MLMSVLEAIDVIVHNSCLARAEAVITKRTTILMRILQAFQVPAVPPAVQILC
jgi:hypothetical protein